MKTTNKITLALLALSVSTLAAIAQNDGPPMDGPGMGGPGGPGGQNGNHQQGRHRPPPLPLVLALSSNHNGIIDSNEIANASAELLTLDKNHDGKLTPDEYMPPRPADAPKNAWHPPTPPIVKALDVNGDGIIDSNEIANATAELMSLDKNHDGQLTRNEYLPPRPHRMDGPPGNGQFAFNDRQGPPDLGQGPPDRHGPPADNQGPPQGPDDRQGPPDNGQGPPDLGQGPPDNGQGPPDDNQGPPGPPNDMP
ncbi:MAG TPA: hypothetical protein VGN23_13690 [Verrucomicrobiae bacterium]|jgi:hypothetical protein